MPDENKLETFRYETNADKIRAMDNLQLAAWIIGLVECESCQFSGKCKSWSACKSMWFKWLGEEAKDG